MTSSEAIAQGLSNEGGLFVPESFPQVDVKALCELDYPAMAEMCIRDRVKAITPNEPGIPARITKAIIKDLNEFAPPTNFVVPMVGAIQDRCV